MTSPPECVADRRESTVLQTHTRDIQQALACKINLKDNRGLPEELHDRRNIQRSTHARRRCPPSTRLLHTTFQNQILYIPMHRSTCATASCRTKNAKRNSSLRAVPSLSAAESSHRCHERLNIRRNLGHKGRRQVIAAALRHRHVILNPHAAQPPEPLHPVPFDQLGLLQICLGPV